MRPVAISSRHRPIERSGSTALSALRGRWFVPETLVEVVRARDATLASRVSSCGIQVPNQTSRRTGGWRLVGRRDPQPSERLSAVVARFARGGVVPPTAPVSWA